jgi:dephospho-CoA kinase
MKVVGLTGGIATGKSVVARMLSEYGAVIVDADDLAREILRPGEEGWKEVRDAFGPEVVGADGAIDRKRLRDLIFRDEEARRRLDAITHPRIRALAQERIRRFEKEGIEVVVYMAPLFFETQADLWLRPVIVVACDPATQKTRLRARDHLSDEEIERHVGSQMPLEEKRRLADIVIENDDDLEKLKARVHEVWSALTA